MEAKSITVSDQEKIKLLSDLIGIQSVNDHEQVVADYIANYFDRHGIRSTQVPVAPGRVNLVASIGSGQPTIVLSGHMDVVSTVEADRWQTDPFKLVEKDGRLYGRGTADMKGGLVDMMVALVELKENNLLRKGTVKFMATVGEEVGGAGSAVLQQKGYTKQIDALIVGEPSAKEIIFAHKGSMDIRLKSKGVAVHSSMPERGYNALNPLIDILYWAKKDFASVAVENSILGPLVYNATILNSGDQVNSLPDLAVAEINARTIPEYNNDQVASHLQKLINKVNTAGAHVNMDVYMSEWPVLKKADNKLTNLAQQVGRNILGIDYLKKPTGGVTDASNLLRDYQSSDFPFMMFGPGDYWEAHKINESVDKERFLRFSEVYEDVVLGFLG